MPVSQMLVLGMIDEISMWVITSFLRHSLLSQWSGRNSLISSEGQRTKLELALPQEANGFARVQFILVSLLTQHCLWLLRMPMNSVPAVHEFGCFSIAAMKIANKIAFHFALTGSFNFIHHFNKLYNISAVCSLPLSLSVLYLCRKYENNRKEEPNNSKL